MAEPYFRSRTVALYHGDALDIMPRLSPVDVVVTDPPQGITSLKWDRIPEEWPSLALNTLVRGGSMWVFTSLRHLVRIHPLMCGWKLAQDVIWEKHNGSSFHADRFRRVHEFAVHYYPKSVPWGEVYKNPQFTMDATARSVRRKQRPPHMGHIERGSYTSQDGGPRLMRSVLRIRSEHGRAIHPTQKPLGILTPLIEYSCAPDATVLDPFAGSGSTLLAAALSGRFAVGIEADEQYCERSAIRLEKALREIDG